MHGLMYKSFIQPWGKLPMILLAVALSTIMLSGKYHLFLGVVSTYFFCACSMAEITEDMKSRWDKYRSCLPLSRAKIVAQSYITMFTMTMISLIFQVVIRIIGLAINNVPITLGSVAEVAPAPLFCCGLVGVVIFFSYRFNYTISFVLYVVICGGIGGVMGFFAEDGDGFSGLPAIDVKMYFIVTIMGVVLFLLSFAASVHSYRKRDI